MTKWIAGAVLSLLLLSGCSALSAVKSVVGGAPTVGVEATLGNKEEAVVGQVGNKQEVHVKELKGGMTTNNIQDIPVEFMLLMLLGWMLPSPQEIYKESKSIVVSTLTLLGNTIRGLFNLFRGK